MSEPTLTPIAIVGASARLPGAASLDAFWELLVAGRDVTTEVDPKRWRPEVFFDAEQGAAGKTYSVRGGFLADVDAFDGPFFGIDADEARKMDPQQRLALQEAWRTFEDAGYAPDGLRGRNVGVFVGARTGDYHDAVLDRSEALEPQMLMGHDTSILSARISHFLDLKGPNLTLNTACSSMGVALHLAVQSLRSGEVEMALVGGVHVMSTAQRFVMHSRTRLLSKTGRCRPFDEAADGFVLGEAVGFVLLKRRDAAVAAGDRIYANILATGVNHDGFCEKGITAPNPDAQAALLRQVLASAAVAPETVDYIEAHGTGTYKGDVIETKALREVYGSGRCVIGSVKANVGHALTAAVLPGLLKVMLCFKHGQLVKQANFERANEAAGVGDETLRVRTETTPWSAEGGQPRRAALSAFSYTGTNFHVVLEEEPPMEVRSGAAEACVVPLSAKTPEALREQVRQLSAWLEAHGAGVELRDVARTLALGRAQLGCRAAFVATTIDGLRARLDGRMPKDGGDARLRDVAARYERGEAVEWSAWVDAKAKTVSLPGYPFERHRYWLNDGKRNDDAVLTVFLARRDEVYKAFVAAGEPAVLVKCGEGGFRQLGPRIFQIDPRRAEDYPRLVAALERLGGGRLRVVHLWNYECEAVDYVFHGDIERCLHAVERSRDTGARAITLLREALAGREADLLFVDHGKQPQNDAVGAGCARLRMKDRTATAAELVALIRLAFTRGHSNAPTKSAAREERVEFRAGETYLVDAGDDVNAVRTVEAWTRRGPGRFVVLTNAALAGRDVVRISPTLAGEDDLRRLRRELERAGVREIHGVVRVLGADGRDELTRTLLLDELTKEGALKFFGFVGEADGFAQGFIELREDLTRRGHRQGRTCVLEAEPVRVESPGSQAQVARFKRIVCEVLRRDGGDVDFAKTPDELGLNSMRIVEVIERVQRTLGTELRPSLFYKHKTLGGVVEEWLGTSVVETTAALPVEATTEVSRCMANEPIAIVGMSGRFPGADNLDAFWANLRDGRDCIGEIPAERLDGWRGGEDEAPKWGGFIADIDKFDAAFFGISAREAELMDPQQRLFLQCAWHAIEDAGYDPKTLAGTQTGVFVGVATCDYAALVEAAGEGRQAHSPIGVFHSILANRLSFLLDLRGPSQPIDTACSSSLVAVHRAVQAMRSGQCEQAIVGGVNALLTAPLFAAFGRAGMLCADGRCKTFDAAANGYVRGEGVAALMLKPLSRALADGDAIHAVIRGSAEGHGGHASSLTAPSAEAQAEVLARAYRDAAMDPRTVGYIEAHGTGTALGDPIEVDGMKQAFARLIREAGDGAHAAREGYCGIGSVKTQIGHLEAAAGMAGMVKVVLAMRHRMLPGNLHYTRRNPYVKLEGSPFFVVGETRAWDAFKDERGVTLSRRAGVSSFGFGGVNAHVVLEEHVAAAGEKSRRVRKPAYPFAKVRHWVAASRVVKEAAQERAMGALRKHWEPCAVESVRTNGDGVVIWANEKTASLAERVSRLLVGGRVVRGTPADLGGVNGVIDLIGCGTARDESVEWIAPVQRWVEDAGERRPLLLGVTAGLESFKNAKVNLAGAERAGLYRMLQSEYPAVRSRHVDIDPQADEAARAEWIAAEFCAGDEAVDVEVCYRGGVRYRACLREIVVAKEAEVKFASERVLWITGGTRGLGALCAAHLVKHAGVRKLVLTGREALPLGAEKAARIRELEALGAEVRVLALDLTDAAAVRNAVAEVTRTMGRVGGVLHCAGIVDEENPAFVRKPLASVREVLAPKVRGTDVLLECFKDEPLAFMVLFSSVAAIMPRLAAGVSDYAMANAYLDYAAEAGGAAFPITSVQWPSWRETGMGEVTNTTYAATGLLSLNNAGGLAWLDRVLAGRLGPVVMPVVFDATRWAPDELMRHTPRATGGAKKGELRAWLAGVFASELKTTPDAVDGGARFQDYGLDSILLAQVWRRINRELGTQLDPSAVYEYPTLDTLAGWLEAHTNGRMPAAATAAVATVSGKPATAERAGDIAVVGMSCRFPGANDLDAYWRLLAEGRTAIRRVPEERWANPEGFVAGVLDDVGVFDPEYFMLSTEDARAMDPQALLVLEESLKVIHHAGYTPAEIKGAAVGVYLGARTRHRPEAEALLAARNPILAVGQNYLAANVSRFFDLRGPSLVVDTACSSALVAMELAVQALRSGDIAAALVGGVNVLASDEAHALFKQRKLLSPDGAFHLFDQRAAGVVLGEGVGMVMLKTLAQAVADGDRVLAVVKGLAINNDGRTAGPATPNVQAQKAVMQAALARSGVGAAEVDYVEANGSGSEVTDLLELKAVESVYGAGRRAPCGLGSVKPNIGHPLCAEGIAGFIKLVLMLERGEQVPFLSGKVAMTHYDLAKSPFMFRREAGAWAGAVRRAALNCFADGGTNAHVVLENARIGATRRQPLAPPVLNRRNLAEPARAWWATIDAEHPLVKNHTAYGQALLPGLAYLDVLYQAFGDSGVPVAEWELGNLSIHHPLAVRAGETICVAVRADDTGGGVRRVRVEGAEAGKTTLYVTAEMRRRVAVTFAETIDLAAIRAGAERIELEDVYAHFRKKGLVHTGVMKAGGTVYVAEDARVIELEAVDGGEGFMFQPTLIDAAAVGAGPIFADLIGGEDRLFLPLFIGRFRATSAIRGRCVARVRKASLRRKNELLYSDIEFFDERGVQVAELTDFAYKLVREAGLVRGAVGTDHSLTLAATKGDAEVVQTREPAGGLGRLLQDVIGAKLRQAPETVDLRLGYYELGLESAMLLELVAALGKRLGRSLSPTLLFEYATPAELAAHLEAEYPDALATPLAEEPADAPSWIVWDFAVGAPRALVDAERKRAETLVADVLRNRVALWMDGGVLKVRALAERLTPELRETIAANKALIAAVVAGRTLWPMSRSQRRYWVLSSLQPGKSAYNNPIGMRLRGDVDVERIKRAFLILMNGHHVLRSCGPRMGREPVVVIAPRLERDVCEVVRADEKALQALAETESRKAINPAVGPNVRVTIVPMAADDAAILLTAHHTVFDGYSYLPVMSEFMRIYRALGRGEIPDMSGVTQYENYTLRERAAGDAASGAFWREHLAGAPAYVALPLDRERPQVNAGNGDTRSVVINATIYRAMLATVQERRVTLFAFMLSVLKAEIAAWTGQADLVFGTTVQCRDEAEDKDVIGDFTNFIPIRTRVEEGRAFGALSDDVYRTTLLCLQHKNYPFDEIVPLAAKAPSSVNPVYNILVNQLPSITQMEERLSDERVRVSVSNNRLLNASAMLDLRFEWYEEGDGLKLICEYNTDLFAAGTIKALLGRVERWLATRAYAADVPEAKALAGVTVREVKVADESAEALLIRLIRELKDVPGIDGMRDVSFFELGLGSFDVANLSAELEAIYPEFAVGEIFKHPTIRALAGRLEGMGRIGPLGQMGRMAAEASKPKEGGAPRVRGGINFDLFRS